MPRDESEIGALWIKTSPRGEYFTGKVGDQAVVVFKNERKKNEREPDYRILKAKPREDRPAREPHNANVREPGGDDIQF